MKITLNYFKAALFVLLGLFIVGCEEDVPGGGGGGTLNNPDVSLNSASSLTVNTNEEFTVSVSASANGTPLNSITVYEGNAKVDLGRIKYDGTAASANPALLFGADKEGFTTDITIAAHPTVGTSTYTIEVADEEGRKSTVFVDVTTNGNPPSFVFGGSGMITVDGGDIVSLKMIAEQGSSPLKIVAVYENDVLIEDVDRLEFAGFDVPENPFEVTGAFKEGFSEDLLVTAPSTAGDYKITLVVTDEAGQTASDDYTITVRSAETPVEYYEGFLLLNAGGPSGTGGADLDITSGTSSVGSSSVEAEIKDLGIDTDRPPSSNWIQRITGANNATIRQIEPGLNGLSESFDYSQITTKEMLPTIFNASTSLSGNTTSVVEVGDMFIVERDGKYYALLMTNVVPTTDNNDDRYEFELKR